MLVKASPKPLTLKHSLGCRVEGRFSTDAGRAGSLGLSASVRDLRKWNRENSGGLDLLTRVSSDKFFHLKIVCVHMCVSKNIRSVQAHLRDTASLVLDHCNKEMAR